MAVRLNVIMVQTPPAGADAHRLSESVVGELIGRPGMDLVLIGKLDQVAPDSTDRLTLDSMSGDVVILDWRDPAQSVHLLQVAGFEGARALHQHDLKASPVSSARRIYAFDLSQFQDGIEVCKALSELLASRRVQTVSIGLSPGSRPVAPSLTKNGRSEPNTFKPAEQNGQGTSQPVNDSASQSRGLSSLDLDELVDQLDDLDP